VVVVVVVVVVVEVVEVEVVAVVLPEVQLGTHGSPLWQCPDHPLLAMPA
jgi:hypothetical protein